MSVATLEILEASTDHRGLVFEPVGDVTLSAQRNTHIVLTEPGAVRGNHFHERATEITAVLGPGLVRLRENDVIRDVMVPAGKVYRFTLPPRVSHAFQNTGDKPMLLIAFSTAVFDREHPDTIRDLLIA